MKRFIDFLTEEISRPRWEQLVVGFVAGLMGYAAYRLLGWL